MKINLLYLFEDGKSNKIKGDIQMNDILIELFYGKINPIENIVPKTQEYKTSLKESCELEEKFLKILNEEEKKQYEDLYNSTMENSLEYSQHVFSHGFKLGAKIIFAVLQD